MPNGEVLAIGGFRGQGAVTLNTAELYDVAGNRWRSAGLLAEYRRSPFAVLLSGGAGLCGDNCGKVLTGSAAVKRKRHKKGTTFRYTLSEVASVRIVISQRASGRRKGKRCVAPARKLRKAKKCTRLIARGTLTRASKQGANRVGFSGRIGRKALKPGRYQATLTATDGAKNTSKPKTISFTIVKR